MHKHDVIILGAGLSGLSTAMHSGGDYLLVERDERVGGLTRTEDIDGFLFNHTGHWLHLRNDDVKQLVADLLPDGMLTVDRKARIYTHGVFTGYPFQANLAGLPAPVLRACVQNAVEAAVRRAAKPRSRPKSFLEYVRHHFGDGIADYFIVPYNTKLWGVSPGEVTADWTQRFVPVPDVAGIVDGALGTADRAMGYNATFLYPAAGGIESLPRAMESRLDPGRIRLKTQPSAINVSEKWVEIEGERTSYDHLVSTLPLPELVALTRDAPGTIRRAAGRLRCSPLRYVNVGLSIERPLDGSHWIYLPEARFPFYRVGSASNAVPSLAPPGRSSLYVELANDQQAPQEDVVRAIAAFLKEIGSIRDESELLFAAFREHPYGYVIYDKPCARARRTILDFFDGNQVQSIGRYGAWTYNSMEDAILDGMVAARRIRGL
ncbi:MAG: FAD-dependent oxidoreductase [Deltaproteobacteria bacterium]|nr:FAD-dependent oxidoreductase [Deltaproteobacteria bacterium]